MRFLSFLSVLLINSLPLYNCMSQDFLPKFQKWVETFKVQFKSTQHFNNILQMNNILKKSTLKIFLLN